MGASGIPDAPFFCTLFCLAISPILLWRKEMRLRIGKSFMESPHGLPAQRLFRPQYVEGVHIRRVHIYLCRDAAGAEPFDIADSLHIKRFPLAYKAIGGRQPGKIRQPRRGGIGGKDSSDPAPAGSTATQSGSSACSTPGHGCRGSFPCPDRPTWGIAASETQD